MVWAPSATAFSHVAAEGDVCLIMGNDTVQHVDELDVVWKGIAA